MRSPGLPRRPPELRRGELEREELLELLKLFVRLRPLGENDPPRVADAPSERKRVVRACVPELLVFMYLYNTKNYLICQYVRKKAKQKHRDGVFVLQRSSG